MKEALSDVCPACRGTKKCLSCEGSGYKVKERPAPIAVISGVVKRETATTARRTCTKCFGSGTCQTCKGTGKHS